MDIKELQKKVIEFREERDWAQYHNPKDLAVSLSLEAAELQEIFQWKDGEQVEALAFMRSGLSFAQKFPDFSIPAALPSQKITVFELNFTQ